MYAFRNQYWKNILDYKINVFIQLKLDFYVQYMHLTKHTVFIFKMV